MDKKYICVLGMGVSDQKIVHIQDSIVQFEDGTELLLPVQEVLTSRSLMHEFVDNFFDKIDEDFN